MQSSGQQVRAGPFGACSEAWSATGAAFLRSLFSGNLLSKSLYIVKSRTNKASLVLILLAAVPRTALIIPISDCDHSMDHGPTRYSTDPFRPRPVFPADPAALAPANAPDGHQPVQAAIQPADTAHNQAEQELRLAVERWHVSLHRAKDAVGKVLDQLSANLPSRILNLNLARDPRQFHNMPGPVWKAYGKLAKARGCPVRTVILPEGIAKIPAGARAVQMKRLILSKFPGLELDLRGLNGNNDSQLRVLIVEPLKLETVRLHVNTVIEVFGGNREIRLEVQKQAD